MTNNLPQTLANRKILVTGGAGFIGSELVRHLIDSGAYVIVLDNLVNGKPENLSNIPQECFRLEIGDIRDKDILTGLMAEVDTVFHLACLGVRHSIHSPQENHEVNAAGSLKLLVAARTANIQRFVYISTSEVYGTALKVPMQEEHPTFPLTVYGGSKLAGECYSRAFHETYKFPTVIIRPFNCFGPRCHHEGDSGEVIPKFLLRSMAGLPMIIHGDGTQTRDFTFVSDTARGIMQIGLCDTAIGQTFNLGNGNEISINDLAHEIEHIIPRNDTQVKHVAPRPGDVLRLYADVTKAEQIVEFKPAVSLKKGLLRLFKWYKESNIPIEQLLEQEQESNWDMGGEWAVLKS